MFNKLLFVDLEYANSLEGNSKICSFGYVLTDTEYNVIEYNDLLCNPEAKFLLNNGSKRGIILGYDVSEFEKMDNFISIYSKIYSLLSAKDTLVIFFSSNGDINALYYAFNRYDLEKPDFVYIDVQKVLTYFSNVNDVVSLDFFNDFFNTGLTRTEHTSLQDAIMTKEATKIMLQQIGFSFNELLKKYPAMFHTFDEYVYSKEFISDNVSKYEDEFVKLSKNTIIETGLILFTTTLKNTYAPTRNRENKFYISVEDLEKDLPHIMKLIYHLGKNGYIYSNDKITKNQMYYNSIHLLCRKAKQKSLESIEPFVIKNTDDPIVNFYARFDKTLADFASIFVNYKRFYIFKKYVGRIKRRIINRACYSALCDTDDGSKCVDINDSEKIFDISAYRQQHNDDQIRIDDLDSNDIDII